MWCLYSVIREVNFGGSIVDYIWCMAVTALSSRYMCLLHGIVFFPARIVISGEEDKPCSERICRIYRWEQWIGRVWPCDVCSAHGSKNKEGGHKHVVTFQPTVISSGIYCILYTVMHNISQVLRQKDFSKISLEQNSPAPLPLICLLLPML